jgi:hypothetical protein
MTWNSIGLPAMSCMTLPGNREEDMRAWMIAEVVT